jgi:hypothetical protein
MLEMDLAGEHPAGSVCQFECQCSAQYSEVDGGLRDSSEPETLPGGTIDPVAEPFVADLEGEPTEQRLAFDRVAVQGFQECDGLIDGFDDDPLVGDTAQCLSFDYLAG